jgi:hypothetical protein
MPRPTPEIKELRDFNYERIEAIYSRAIEAGLDEPVIVVVDADDALGARFVESNTTARFRTERTSLVLGREVRTIFWTWEQGEAIRRLQPYLPDIEMDLDMRNWPNGSYNAALVIGDKIWVSPMKPIGW